MTLFPVSSVRLVGCNGQVWDLLDLTSPVSLSTGMGGLHLPPVIHQWATTPGRPGRVHRGVQTDSRVFLMRIMVGDQQQPFRTGEDWRQLDGQFWNSLSEDGLATLIVNDRRKLDFRLDNDNDFDFPQDPAILGKAVYPINCIADSPYWHGEPITETFVWEPFTEMNYYGGAAGVGPPFVIAEADLFQSALVTNPGDLPAWPIWKVTGPAATARIGVGEDVISPSFSLNDGDIVVFDTEAETIVDAQGANLWPQMGNGQVDFAPIPPGEQVPISIGLDGGEYGASVTVTLTPRYKRAWGMEVGGTVVLPPGVGGTGGLGDMPLGDGPLGD